jgi:hypothetical protein
VRDIIEITEKLRDLTFELEINYEGCKVLNCLKELRKIMFVIIYNDLPEEKLDLTKPFDLEVEGEVFIFLIKFFNRLLEDYPTKLKVKIRIKVRMT